MNKSKKYYSRPNKRKNYNQKNKRRKAPYKRYKITFVSYDDPKFQDELDNYSYREYLSSYYGGDYYE